MIYEYLSHTADVALKIEETSLKDLFKNGLRNEQYPQRRILCQSEPV